MICNHTQTCKADCFKCRDCKFYTALANVHIKDRTHAGMQAVPALLASLHALSGHDDTQNAARAREEQAERDYQRSQARQRPAAGPAPAASSAAPREFRYKVSACIHATSAEIITMIAQSDAETRRLRAEVTCTPASTRRPHRLAPGLPTRKQRRAASRPYSPPALQDRTASGSISPSSACRRPRAEPAIPEAYNTPLHAQLHPRFTLLKSQTAQRPLSPHFTAHSLATHAAKRRFKHENTIISPAVSVY
jgi:hypothetical protein